MSAASLECCRDATGKERRHLRVMGEEHPLCGNSSRQTGAGGGTFSSLLKWPTCGKCRKLARVMGPADSQRDDRPLRMEIQS